MKLDIQKFMNLFEFLPSPINYLFQKGIKMKTAKTLILLMISLMFALSSCMNPQNEEQPSSEGPVVLEINLGGNSRAERFLGTFDQINRMSLDIKRVYGNKMINTDLELSFDNNTGNWKGTVNNLIVGFDYEITGHAYRLYDNVTDDFVTAFTPKDNSTKFVEIFQGSVTHTVQDGLNTLNLRLSPILDSRNLSVPRITHIYRPFQMVASTNDNITVKVSTVSKSGSNSIDASLNFRFRSVDNSSMPIADNGSNLGGTFSPDQDVIQHQGGGSYPDIETTYTAPDNRSTQKIQIRVSNEQEIGVVQHFIINVTDDLDTEHTIDTNPVIESFSAERISNSQLKFVVSVSNDDGFSGLQYKWEYLFGDQKSFTQFDQNTDANDYNRGSMQAILNDYQDSDEGMVLLTVCEDGGQTGSDGNVIPSNCAYGNEASTSMQFELIPNAYQQPIICDVGYQCASEFDNSWIACDTNDENYDGLNFAARRLSMDIGSGKITRTEEFMNDPTCVDNASVQITHIFETTWDNEDNITMVNYSPDNHTQVEAKKGTLKFDKVGLRIDNISLLQYLGTNICGYEYWTNVTNDVTGCDDRNFQFPDNGTTIKAVARVENNIFRWETTDNSSEPYPTELNCNQFGLESAGNYLLPISNSSSCKDSNSSHSSGHSLFFDNVTGIFHDYSDNLTIRIRDNRSETKSWHTSNCAGFSERLPTESELKKYSFGPNSMDSNFHALLQNHQSNDFGTRIWVSDNYSGPLNSFGNNNLIYSYSSDNSSVIFDNNAWHYSVCVKDTY